MERKYDSGRSASHIDSRNISMSVDYESNCISNSELYWHVDINGTSLLLKHFQLISLRVLIQNQN